MLAEINLNPLSILGGDAFEIQTGATEVYTLLNLGSLYSVLLMIVIYIGACVILYTAIKLFFLKKKEERAEHKKGIAFAFFILFIVVNAIPIFNRLLAMGQHLQAT